MIVGGNAAHVVVHGGQHGNGLLCDVHLGKDPCGLSNARQPFRDDGWIQVGQVQVYVVLFRSEATPFADLDGNRATYHVP